MRKIGFALGLFLLVSLFIAGAAAAGPAVAKKRNKAGIYSGEVAELDLKTKKMVVAQNNTDLAMVFNTGRARVGSGYKELGELKVGDQVNVKFEAKVGVIYALTVARGKKDEPVKSSGNFTHPPIQR